MAQQPEVRPESGSEGRELFLEWRARLETEMRLLQDYFAARNTELSEEETDFIFELKDLHSDLYDYKSGTIEQVSGLIEKSRIIRQK